MPSPSRRVGRPVGSTAFPPVGSPRFSSTISASVKRTVTTRNWRGFSPYAMCPCLGCSPRIPSPACSGWRISARRISGLSGMRHGRSAAPCMNPPSGGLPPCTGFLRRLRYMRGFRFSLPLTRLSTVGNRSISPSIASEGFSGFPRSCALHCSRPNPCGCCPPGWQRVQGFLFTVISSPRTFWSVRERPDSSTFRGCGRDSPSTIWPPCSSTPMSRYQGRSGSI